LHFALELIIRSVERIARAGSDCLSQVVAWVHRWSTCKPTDFLRAPTDLSPFLRNVLVHCRERCVQILLCCGLSAVRLSVSWWLLEICGGSSFEFSHLALESWHLVQRTIKVLRRLSLSKVG
jgi:hypothetical protein